MTVKGNLEGGSVHKNLMKLLDRSGVCVLIAAGENGRVISANETACSFLNVPHDEITGVPVEELMRSYYEEGLPVDRELVEENSVVYQVFSFRAGSLDAAASEEDLKRVIRDLDDLYFKTTMNGIVISVSPSVEKFAGYKPSEVIGQSILGFYKNPEDREYLLKDLQNTGILSEYELQLVRKDGTCVYTRGSIHIVYDDQGKPQFIEGLITDITRSKKLEEELKSSSEYFRQVVESVPDAVITIDRQGLVTSWNREASNIFGWTPEEAMGRSLDDLVRTESGKNEIESLKVIEGEVVKGLECTRRGKMPGEKKVFVSVAPIVINGESMGAVGIYTDLSDRESILEKLRANQVRFKSITDSAQDAVIIMDENGCISFFNGSAERMFGYHRTETIGKRLHKLLAPETYGEMFEMGFPDFRKTGRGIVIGRVMEMEGRRKDGTVFPVEVSVSSYYTEGGWHATGILRDITDRKRTELELIEAREGALNAVRTKSEFLANMSHEIRTPLNAIIGTTDLLWETNIDQRQRNYLRVCRNAGENLLALINDILDISKVEAGRVELENIPFDLCETVEKTCETLALRAHEKELELNSRILPGTPRWVIGDPSRLRQILINLIGNSIKFTEKGEVTVTVGRNPDKSTYFSVKDTGIGIPEGKLESIFMSFTQADTSHTRRFGGTGLGLTICRKLVELMDGTISVSSELNRGSEFTFSVLLEEAAPREADARDGSRESLQGVKALVVDDNESNRAILREILEGWNAAVSLAENGSEAVRILENESFDVILLDCSMPGMNGFQVLEELKQLGISRDPVIMMLKADGSAEGTGECRKLGIQRYVFKPVRRLELKEMINSLLSGKPGTETEVSAVVERIPVEDRKLSILLAEDSPDNRFLIIKYLEAYPWELKVAEDGREAVDLYENREAPFDVILMDMQMPVMDGYEATRAIRAMESREQSQHTPIVALTAHAMTEEIKKCMDAGCDLHISKPVRKKTLIRELNDLLSATGAKEGTPEIEGETVIDEDCTARVSIDLEPLIPGYLENRKKDIRTITEHVENGNFSEAARLAHSMKGSGGGYGFDRITELGAMMEIAARNSDGAVVLSGLEQLKHYLKTVKIEYVDED